jgi:hypothetical protein
LCRTFVLSTLGHQGLDSSTCFDILFLTIGHNWGENHPPPPFF